MSIVLSVDAMGGDHGINVTIPAAIRFVTEHADVRIILAGDSSLINKHLSKRLGNKPSPIASRIEVVNSTEIVAMDALPQVAMRLRDSSMRVAINLVKDGKAQAIISAGNTGALMATARYVLRTMNGIDRPAIAKLLPTMKGYACMLDLGANVESTAEHLFQFAVMGAQLMRTIKKNPSIGLLNIGSEASKGNEVIKHAAELLKNSSLNFYGNVEGNDINKGTVDVIVCDGFTGNVALKTIEGVAKMIAAFIKEEFKRNFLAKLIAILSYPVLGRLKARLDPRQYNGAVLIGLNALVIKSHGGADKVAFYYALEQAYHEVNAGVTTMLEECLRENNLVDMSAAVTTSATTLTQE